MSRGRSWLLTLVAVVVAALLDASVAVADQAAQLYPIDLRVSGGEQAWHAENDFRLDWDRPPVAAEFPVSAIGYRVRDANRATVRTVRQPWDATTIEHIHVPPVPGIYTADVWLEGPSGERGPEVSAALRFDDVRPGAVRPLAPAGWIAGGTPARVTIERPAAALPVSGIRGYAVSIDRGDGSTPCASRDRCRLDETDLDGGIDDDTVSLGILPEGTSIVRAVAVSGSGMSSAEVGSVAVRVDATRPALALTGVPRDWASEPVRLAATATDALSGMGPAGPNGPYTAISVDGAVPRAERGGSVAVTVTGEGRHGVAFYARDAAGNASDGSPVLATVPIDESPPHVAFARAQDKAEPERIEAMVADALSGPDPVRGSIAMRPAGSHQRWLQLATATTAGRLSARWASDSFPAGAYEFRATGYDRAGNSSVSGNRANGARMVLANPLKAPAEIQAGFGRGRANKTSVRYGHGAIYGGRLSSAAGSPLSQMPVKVVEVFADGSDLPQRTTTVETAADGTFRTRLSPGPSRAVEAVFGGNPVLTRASGGPAQMDVAAGVRLRASAASARVGGAPVVFSGRLGDLGAGLRPDGRSVELQFRLPHRPWAEFRTVQTDAAGRFRYAYAFSDDDSRGVRFQFRAYPTGGDWPYEPAASKSVTVTGR